MNLKHVLTPENFKVYEDTRTVVVTDEGFADLQKYFKNDAERPHVLIYVTRENIQLNDNGQLVAPEATGPEYFKEHKELAVAFSCVALMMELSKSYQDQMHCFVLTNIDRTPQCAAWAKDFMNGAWRLFSYNEKGAPCKFFDVQEFA